MAAPTSSRVASAALTALFVLGDADQAYQILEEAVENGRVAEATFDLLEATAKTLQITVFDHRTHGAPIDLYDAIDGLVGSGFVPPEDRESTATLLLIAAAQAGGIRVSTTKFVGALSDDPVAIMNAAWLAACAAVRLVAGRTDTADSHIVARYLSE